MNGPYSFGLNRSLTLDLGFLNLNGEMQCEQQQPTGSVNYIIRLRDDVIIKFILFNFNSLISLWENNIKLINNIFFITSIPYTRQFNCLFNSILIIIKIIHKKLNKKILIW